MPQFRALLKRARGDAVARDLSRQTDRKIAELRATLAAQQRTLTEIQASLAKLADARPGPSSGKPAPIKEVGSSGIISTIDNDAWATVAQDGELGFHKRPNMRSRADWAELAAADWRELGFEPDTWRGQTIIDVGAGSRLRTLYFEGATLIALEPLAERFASEVEWQDIDKADEVYAVPAEKLVPELVDRADLIVSLNALDHGYDFDASVGNLRRYAKDDALVFLSFDQHEVPDHMHPLVLNDKINRAVFERHGFKVEKASERRRYHGTAGLPALNYWLRPVPSED